MDARYGGVYKFPDLLVILRRKEMSRRSVAKNVLVPKPGLLRPHADLEVGVPRRPR